MCRILLSVHEFVDCFKDIGWQFLPFIFMQLPAVTCEPRMRGKLTTMDKSVSSGLSVVNGVGTILCRLLVGDQSKWLRGFLNFRQLVHAPSAMLLFLGVFSKELLRAALHFPSLSSKGALAESGGKVPLDCGCQIIVIIQVDESIFNAHNIS